MVRLGILVWSGEFLLWHTSNFHLILIPEQMKTRATGVLVLQTNEEVGDGTMKMWWWSKADMEKLIEHTQTAPAQVIRIDQAPLHTYELSQNKCYERQVPT